MPTKFVATLDGADHQLEAEELGAHALRLKIGKRQFEVDVHRVGPSSYSILIDNRSFDFEVVRDGEEIVVASRGGAARVTLADAARRSHNPGARPAAAGKAMLKAMMPGRVVNVLVNLGDEVAAQQGLLVIEAMKMENELKAPKAGKIVELKVKPGQTVEKGELLLVVE
ncbi:MAG TPA: biotin/lipoyl-containing protein [Candidatus Binataceae bacterium]|jgi:biotin carboxyl carrier protein|nr:biotin/lipoyl-containing protein [Candidatus Binataceae bacterium]